MSSDTNSERDSWRFISVFLAAWLLLMLLPALVVAIIDPYQVFHRTFLPKVYFYKENERYQMAGLIKNYLGPVTGTDSIIIGTSLSNNFLDEDVQSRLGWSALNLSMRGSTLAERSFVLERAIETGHVRRVIFEINPIDFLDDALDPKTDQAFPAYLYSNAYNDKGRYLFNQTVALQALALCRQSYPFSDEAVLSAVWPSWNGGAWHEGLRHWMAWMETTERTSVFSDFSAPEHRVILKADLDNQKAQRKNAENDWQWRQDYPFTDVKKYLITVVRAHPEIDFRIWFPPVSTMRYAAQPSMDMINRVVEMRRIIVRSLADSPHARIYGLDGEYAVTGNLSNYMDTQHFTMQIQQWVLDSIASEQYRLSPDNIDSYLVKLKDTILGFDIAVPQQQAAEKINLKKYRRSNALWVIVDEFAYRH